LSRIAILDAGKFRNSDYSSAELKENKAGFNKPKVGGSFPGRHSLGRKIVLS
jgi:hypothetical protein